MSNYDLNRHKKSDKVKWVLTLIVGIMLVGACSAMLAMGIRNNGWFKPAENTPVEDTGEITSPDDNTGEENGGETTVKVLQSATFDSADGVSSNSFFTVSGNQTYGTYDTPVGELSKSLKMETTTSITFTTDIEMVLTIYTIPDYVGKVINIDGKSYTFAENSDGYTVVEISISSGEHSITKGNTVVVTYLTLSTVETENSTSTGLKNGGIYIANGDYAFVLE
ncbi:MAG: hypothetical protein ACI4MS_06410 [Candidatus Coproplasma sp.]